MQTSTTLTNLEAHVSATWNVWQRHVQNCKVCKRAVETMTLPYTKCLAGANAYEEWHLANARYGKQYMKERSHQTPVVPRVHKHS